MTTPEPARPSPWRGLHSDAAWQAAERATRLAIGFALSSLVARTLGPATFGVYVFALSIVALFAFLGQAGIDSLLLRELVRRPDQAADTLSSSLVLRLLGAVLAGIASIATAFFAAADQSVELPLLVLVLSFSGTFQAGWVVEALLQANHKFRSAAIGKMCAYVAAALLRLIALFSDEPLLALAFATLLESAICTVLLWRISRVQLHFGFEQLCRPALGSLRAMARMAAPMLLSALSIAVYTRIDVFMLGKIIGTSAAGLYGAATLLSEGFYLIPIAVMAAAAPRLSLLFVRDPDAFAHDLSRILILLSAAGFLTAVATTLAAPVVVPLLFGSSYAPAAGILQIHVWSTWMVFISTASDAWYINNDLRRLYLVKTAVAALANIGLNLVLIPRWQGQGAALATVISYAISAIGIGLLWPQTRSLARMQLRAICGLRAKPIADRT